MDNYFEPWLSYKHPIVRQLAFCIASPNIIQSHPQELEIKNHFELHHTQFWQQQFNLYQRRLAELDNNPEPLILFLQQLKSTRIGLRFEYLFWFWLQDEANPHFKLIQHSIQIIEGKNTLGEIDFLVLNRATQQIEQWEVALKYYLGEANLSLPNWYGLNRSDTLFRKLNHFTIKQFQFTQALDLNIENKFAVMKGQLYLPYSTNNNVSLPVWLNPARRVGTWGNYIDKNLYRLQRHEWICPNVEQSSPTAQWWCNGLYHNHNSQEFYMFRQAALLSKEPFTL
ncbi:MAG: DUF1853 family protein [Acinetobacter sp.]